MGGSFRTRGQPAALAIIERAVLLEQPPHALLLVGPPRVGKTTLALDLAAGLLCQAEAAASRPCRACSACRRVESGGHPDVHLLAPEGAGQQIRLAGVQALAAELALLPLEGRFRVALIEHAQRLNLDAQNALLKTLEEPPPKVVIVLVADEPAGLLPTVSSRSARVRLGPVRVSVVGDLVEERSGLDRARGEMLARLTGGSVGDALDLAAQPELLLARARLVRGLLDLLGADRRTRLGASPALLADGAELAAGAAGGRLAEAGQAVDGHDDDDGPAGRDQLGRRGVPAGRSSRGAPAERRAAVGRVLEVWRGLARDLALASRGGSAELRQRDLIDEIAIAATGLDPLAMARFVERIDSLGRALDAYANPDLVLDMLLLEWPASGQAARGKVA